MRSIATTGRAGWWSSVSRRTTSEPGSAKQIADFCETTYGVKFPLHAKTQVRGARAHPVYRALRAQTGKSPIWNFHKYLIDRQGTRALAFSSDVRPDDATLTAAIERLLAETR